MGWLSSFNQGHTLWPFFLGVMQRHMPPLR
jgi:hypothetical protein